MTAVLLSYALNRSFTFGSQRPHIEGLPRFFITAAGCFALNLVVLKLSMSVFALPLAQVLAMGTYTVAFYLCSRYLVFRTGTFTSLEWMDSTR